MILKRRLFPGIQIRPIRLIRPIRVKKSVATRLAAQNRAAVDIDDLAGDMA